MFKLCKKLLQLQVERRFYSSSLSDLHGTLHLRFLDHLKKYKQIKSESKLSKQIQLLREKTEANTPDLNETYKDVDNECLKNIRQCKKDEIYELLDTLVQAVPVHVANMRAFPEALRMLLNKFDSNPNKEDFLKLCFYLGLFKKKLPGPILLKSILDDHLDKMLGTDMSTLDFAILSTAAYKASVRIPSKKFEQQLIHEVVNTDKIDELIFVTFIKSLRMNRINSVEVFKRLKQLCNDGELNELSFISFAHVYAIVADNFIKDEELSDFFIEKCVDKIETDTRAKDIQKLLYSCALLNHPMKADHLKKLEQQIMTRTEHKEYYQKFDNFVDAALSLWMLNHKSRELVKKLLEDSRFYSKEIKSRIKIDSRKKLLLTCIEIEEPEIIQHMKILSPSFDEERPAPRYLIKPSLEKQLKLLKGNNFRIVQQVKHLNIAGILVKESNGRNQHFEVLDNSNSLSDGISPNGIFALKLRLMKKMKCIVKVVSYSYIVNFDL